MQVSSHAAPNAVALLLQPVTLLTVQSVRCTPTQGMLLNQGMHMCALHRECITMTSLISPLLWRCVVFTAARHHPAHDAARLPCLPNKFYTLPSIEDQQGSS